ncbi:MAG TPA: hypothetical protein PKE69_11530 [Pyrinomonadaceae bacterium]|nr:hypothetical protein [Pyrinomonadaceae bacterium]
MNFLPISGRNGLKFTPMPISKSSLEIESRLEIGARIALGMQSKA